MIDDARGEESVLHADSTSSVSFDRTNNVEMIEFFPSSAGIADFTVRVAAHTVGSGTPQKFARVVYNAYNVNNGTHTPPASPPTSWRPEVRRPEGDVGAKPSFFVFPIPYRRRALARYPPFPLIAPSGQPTMKGLAPRDGEKAWPPGWALGMHLDNQTTKAWPLRAMSGPPISRHCQYGRGNPIAALAAVIDGVGCRWRR